ncbi:hypothetical protein [Streptoalloteichus hindustanus]|uniref:Integral membrane protein n=1 Tax=Streptoalloteichus hindustanus TaxID=2017 RepID=A0A1M5JSV8_STRHI|nr:hypothetical protein [Streptoalloteichus hindustanus]SHG43626.1 hypothetical protein SAMN05444320_10922 [Streptoalloteichus hindustanus]
MQTLVLSTPSRLVAGLVLLTVVTIEVGGWYLTKVTAGRVPLTDFQKAFARAGHAHAGVLVTLGLVCLVLADATRLDGALGWIARLGVPAAAVLMSAGFFASSLSPGATRPNRLIAVLWVGAAALAAGVVTLGIGLLTS